MTLLHGENGVGKTIVLRMVNAILKGHFGFFLTIPFTRFTLGFHDGSALTLTASDPTNEEGGKYELTLQNNGVKVHSEELNLGISEASFIAERVGYLRQEDEDTWIDIRDGEMLSSSDVISRFGRHSSTREHRSRHDISWFETFRRNANVHLIEAQRLSSHRLRNLKRPTSIHQGDVGHRPFPQSLKEVRIFVGASPTRWLNMGGNPRLWTNLFLNV